MIGDGRGPQQSPGRQVPSRILLERSASEPDLVAVGIAIQRLPHTVGIRLPLHGLDPASGDLGDESVEIVNEDRLDGVTGVLGVLLDEERSVLGKLPHRFCVGCDEGRLGAQQSHVPGFRSLIVTDADSSEQVEWHAAMLRGMGGPAASRKGSVDRTASTYGSPRAPGRLAALAISDPPLGHMRLPVHHCAPMPAGAGEAPRPATTRSGWSAGRWAARC
jgi:hypothetical protein